MNTAPKIINGKPKNQNEPIRLGLMLGLGYIVKLFGSVVINLVLC